MIMPAEGEKDWARGEGFRTDEMRENSREHGAAKGGQVAGGEGGVREKRAAREEGKGRLMICTWISMITRMEMRRK